MAIRGIASETRSLADDENGALAILRIRSKFKNGIYSPTFNDLPLPFGMEAKSTEHTDYIADILDSIEELSEAPQLNEQQSEGLKSEWKQWKTTVEDARKLRHFARGHSAARSATDPVNLQLHLAAASVTRLLRGEIYRCCQAERFEDALDSSEALFAVSRIIRDDPTTHAIISRITWATLACQCAQRLLAQGESDSKRLTALQQLLEEDDQFDHLRAIIRAESADSWAVFCSWRDGKLDGAVRELYENPPKFEIKLDPDPEPPWYARWLPAKKPNSIDPRKRQAQHLRTAKLWSESALKPGMKKANDLEAMLDRDVKVFDTVGFRIPRSLIAQMRVRTAYTAIAVERYRRDSGSWPKSLVDLAPKYLASVPEDFYAGKPLLCRRVDDGIVVYSVGPDGKDDGGRFRAGKDEIVHPVRLQGLDIGVRLWDPAHRRQPPLPPVKPRPKSEP